MKALDQRAAEVLQPGERVIIGEGVYRECVRPARGGTGPGAIISYEAAPGAKVIIKGSEWLKTPWDVGPSTSYEAAPIEKIWMVNLPPELFIGYNPFAIPNYPTVDEMGGPYVFHPRVTADFKRRYGKKPTKMLKEAQAYRRHQITAMRRDRPGRHPRPAPDRESPRIPTADRRRSRTAGKPPLILL